MGVYVFSQRFVVSPVTVIERDYEDFVCGGSFRVFRIKRNHGCTPFVIKNRRQFTLQKMENATAQFTAMFLELFIEPFIGACNATTL